MTVLDGAVIQAAGIDVLGDDDPEHNIPFSVDRTHGPPRDRGAVRRSGWSRCAQARQVDVILRAPARRVDRGDRDARTCRRGWSSGGTSTPRSGPIVITHDDGSWTVGMQQGTAGGVQQPTFTSFSTPFSPPLISADVYFYFRDDATGLITAVQPVHFLPDARW